MFFVRFNNVINVVVKIVFTPFTFYWRLNFIIIICWCAVTFYWDIFYIYTITNVYRCYAVYSIVYIEVCCLQNNAISLTSTSLYCWPWAIIEMDKQFSAVWSSIRWTLSIFDNLRFPSSDSKENRTLITSALLLIST